MKESWNTNFSRPVSTSLIGLGSTAPQAPSIFFGNQVPLFNSSDHSDELEYGLNLIRIKSVDDKQFDSITEFLEQAESLFQPEFTEIDGVIYASSFGVYLGSIETDTRIGNLVDLNQSETKIKLVGIDDKTIVSAPASCDVLFLVRSVHLALSELTSSACWDNDAYMYDLTLNQDLVNFISTRVSQVLSSLGRQEDPVERYLDFNIQESTIDHVMDKTDMNDIQEEIELQPEPQLYSTVSYNLDNSYARVTYSNGSFTLDYPGTDEPRQPKISSSLDELIGEAESNDYMFDPAELKEFTDFISNLSESEIENDYTEDSDSMDDFVKTYDSKESWISDLKKKNPEFSTKNGYSIDQEEGVDSHLFSAWFLTPSGKMSYLGNYDTVTGDGITYAADEN